MPRSFYKLGVRRSNAPEDHSSKSMEPKSRERYRNTEPSPRNGGGRRTDWMASVRRWAKVLRSYHGPIAFLQRRWWDLPMTSSKAQSPIEISRSASGEKRLTELGIAPPPPP